MPFSTSELLAHAQFAEFDAADLAFRVGETAALLNARCSDRVDADTVVRLHERVEGWPMGLQLALVDLERTRSLRPEGQKAIAGYKIEGEQLFFPNHGAK